MPNFSTDADLLAYEPNVFHELPFVSQTKLRVTDAAISGRDVTSTTGGFTTLSPGDVAVIGDGAFAIATIVSNTVLTLATTPVGVSGPTLTVRTFAPQAAAVHADLMRAIGIDAADPDNELDGSAVLSLDLMGRLETLGTLTDAYTAAIPIAGERTGAAEKAERYRQLFKRRLNGATVLIDLNGDGQADVARYPGVGRLERV